MTAGNTARASRTRKRTRIQEANEEKILDAGLELHIWTVDEPEVAKRYIDWGAKSITTNRSHWLKEQLTSMDKK